MLPEYEFTLPICGKSITWRPLSIGASLDIGAQYKNNEAMLGPALVMRRIVRYDGKEGQPQPTEWRNWDELDYGAFVDFVNEQEAARAASFRKKRAGENPAAQLEAAISDAQTALGQVGRCLQAVLELHKVAEASRDPLASPPTSTPSAT